MVEDTKIATVLIKKAITHIKIGDYYFNYDSAEELKNWLEEALKPRYRVYVVNDGNPERSRIEDLELNEIVAIFYSRDGFDCIARAEKYCEQLNKENKE